MSWKAVIQFSAEVETLPLGSISRPTLGCTQLPA